jgi:peptidoglycan/xylan/chitin deacetylase (PgdA/CDA1 family)
MKIKIGLIFGLAILVFIGTTWWLSLKALPVNALPGLTATFPVEPSLVQSEPAPSEELQPGSTPTLIPPSPLPPTPRASPSPRVKSATPTLTLLPSPIPSFTSLPTIVLPQNLLQSPGLLQEDFENAKQWLKIVGSTTPDAAPEHKTGQGALRLKGDDNRIVVERRVQWNLSASDCIRLWVDQPQRGSGVFEIVLSTRENFSSYFSKEVKPNPIGWTLVQICRGDFSNVRGATWKEPVIRVRIQVNPGDEFYFDSLYTHVTPLPVIMIGFDDANASDYRIAYPILKRLKIPATSYIPTTLVNTPGHMNVPQLLELQANGWIIGNHTAHHVLLRDLSETDQQSEIATALRTLESWGITGGKHLAYPVGKYNPATLTIMERLGMLSGRSVSNARDVFPQINKFILRDTQDISGFSLAEVKSMVDQTLTNRGILMLLFHNLAEGDSLEGTEWNRAKFGELMNYIAQKQVMTLTIDQFVRLADGEVTIERAR